MHLDQSFSELIGSIYQGPLEDSPWQGFLALLRETMGAANTSLVLRPPSDQSRGVLLTDGGSLEGIASYNERLFVLDPFVGLQPGEVKSLLDFVSEEELLGSELYRVCMLPAGLFDSLGADMRVGGELEVRLRIARVRGAQAFTGQDRELVRSLIPHLERAILIHSRLNKIESERALYAGAVEQLSVGSIILDEKGRLLNHNEMAGRLLEQKDGLYCVNHKLQLSSRQQTAELHNLISDVLDKQNAGEPAVVQVLRVGRPSGLQDLGLVIRPVPGAEWSEGRAAPSVVIFISDPELASEPPFQAITRLFGFTPAEASLALMLSNGLTLDEASGQLNVSRNTARTHLRSVFAKTGVSRQPMLVRLILKSVAALA